ncbi:4a-hydroxytetrahydrobiopterin dehydratase [Aphanothece hegewaldii CCALA 016]|uniref:Putative pterin-4-alpha-carbinolamine dehydratase n=1 Tax=Aphanothece hegewaldii CCALA 016 TaxID=2107694 RepID=A0A2T1M2G0_9CHRO|nr:4a-hydroxytetrahydrobiopterin dehydratase [Aphanothece hegewaldii]PSF38948.1 4a-hydroxytetrahydrobiopterin dehydratase [Aphanothece hegewaldii CCALA 016]
MKSVRLLLRKPWQSLIIAIIFCGLELTIASFLYAIPVNPLTESEIQQQLRELPGWTRKNQQLQRTFMFKNFVEAIAFVNQLVEPTEKLQHHPDLLILYNRVTITLSTHDANGLTQKDFDLAKIISKIAETRIEK